MDKSAPPPEVYAPPPYNPNPAPPYPAGSSYPPPGGNYPPPGGNYPPPGGNYPPPGGNYPPPAANYGPPAGQPQPPPGGQTVVVVQGGAGTCGSCGIGYRKEDYTCCGIALAIIFFPLGLICCLLMKESRCTHCGKPM